MPNPNQMANTLLELADKYAKKGRRLNELKRLYAEYYKDFRKEVKSDAALDRKWDLTLEGQAMEELKMKMKVYEIKASAIKNYLRVLENESRNNY